MEQGADRDDALAKLIEGETGGDQPDNHCGVYDEDEPRLKASAWSLRNKRTCAACGVCSVFIVLLFTLLLPMIAQGLLNDCDVEVVQAVIMYPGNISFSSETTVKMKGGVPVPASLKFQELTIHWNHENGGNVIELGKTNSIKVTGAERTLRAVATVTDSPRLSAMMSNALNNVSYVWTLKGRADVTAFITMDTHVDKTVNMKGYDGFPYAPIVQNFSVIEGTPSVLFASANCSLTTDANTAFVFGQDVHFTAMYAGYSVGLGYIPNAAFYTGTFDFLTNIGCQYSSNEERKALMQLISSYVQGQDSRVELRGFYLKDPIAWLTQPLYGITMYAAIPGVSSPLVQQYDLYISLPSPLHIDFTMNAYNPVDVEMTIIRVIGEVYYKNTLVGLVDDVNIEVTIPPKSVATSELLYAQILPGQVPLVVELVADGFGLLDIHTIITCYMGKFEMNITYSQYNISAYVHEGLPGD